jgi:hypothetical protein
MSRRYSFAIVPFELDDGYYGMLFKDNGKNLADGVTNIEGLDVSMNDTFCDYFNRFSEGYWQAFLVGGPLKWNSNGRYIILDKRRQSDARLLKNLLERMRDFELYDSFNELFANMELAIASNPGKSVALIIN